MEGVKSEINLHDLAKIDIRVGEILCVIDIGESDRLVKLYVDFGEFKRTILVGIKGERDNIKDIEGIQALFVVNIKPKVIMGVESEGMLLSIGYKEIICPLLAIPEKSTRNGLRVS